MVGVEAREPYHLFRRITIVDFSIDAIVAQINKNFLARADRYIVTIGGANSAPNKQSLLQQVENQATKFIGGIGGSSSPIGSAIQSLMNPTKDSAKISSGQVPDA